MKYRIHYQTDFSDCSFVISGDTVEEIRDKAKNEMSARNVKDKDCWSECIGD